VLTSDFDYELPPEAIAQQPLVQRDRCRLAVIHRLSGEVQHRRFDQIGESLRPGDLLVLNDSRVLPARIPCQRPTGGAVEVFLLDPAREGDLHQAFLKPAHKLQLGEALTPLREPLAGNFALEARLDEGVFALRWSGKEPYTTALLERLGVMPLPPYIQRPRLPEGLQALEDQSAYQTVYAKDGGSVAAPTAGLHFSPELLASLQAQGIDHAQVTLHVGAGTFLPVKTEALEDHPMHIEHYCIPDLAHAKILACRQGGGRVIAVGTTALRTLESAARQVGFKTDTWYATQLFLKPGDVFQATDALLTNFHQPRSTLLPLVSAFWTREQVLELYRVSLNQKYRFLSYGDACLFL
jgi:S-adenosylmethionine:tRNA ribosyltransferase-isomerase